MVESAIGSPTPAPTTIILLRVTIATTNSNVFNIRTQDGHKIQVKRQISNDIHTTTTNEE